MLSGRLLLDWKEVAYLCDRPSIAILLFCKFNFLPPLEGRDTFRLGVSDKGLSKP